MEKVFFEACCERKRSHFKSRLSRETVCVCLSEKVIFFFKDISLINKHLHCAYPPWWPHASEQNKSSGDAEEQRIIFHIITLDLFFDSPCISWQALRKCVVLRVLYNYQPRVCSERNEVIWSYFHKLNLNKHNALQAIIQCQCTVYVNSSNHIPVLFGFMC